MDPDEQYGTAVFRVLGGEPGPSTVDVFRAVVEGERHHRRVRLAGSAGAAATVLAVVAAAWTVTGTGRTEQPSPVTVQPPTSSPSEAKKALACPVRQLATPAGNGPKAGVSGADPTGRYIVGRSYPHGKPTTMIWVDQRPQPAPMPGDDPLLYDITSTGMAVGSSFVGNKTAAWVYTGGKYTRLAGGEAQALAINER